MLIMVRELEEADKQQKKETVEGGPLPPLF